MKKILKASTEPNDFLEAPLKDLEEAILLYKEELSARSLESFKAKSKALAEMVLFKRELEFLAGRIEGLQCVHASISQQEIRRRSANKKLKETMPRMAEKVDAFIRETLRSASQVLLLRAKMTRK